MFSAAQVPACGDDTDDVPADSTDHVPVIAGRQFSEAGYREFKKHTLEEAAMAAARSGSVTKVQLLSERHPDRLVPGMLALLGCFTETAPHDLYSQLLSLVDPLHPIPLVCFLPAQAPDCVMNLLPKPCYYAF